MLKRCAFLTMQDMTGFFAYDQLAIEPLNQLGWSVEEIPWDQADVVWGQYQAVVIRSTWDYQNRPAEFLRVLEAIEASGAKLFNPAHVCQWNMHKGYLRDLSSKGCPTLPTIWVERMVEGDVARWCRELNSSRLVIKPTVGANADHAFVLSEGDPDSASIAYGVYRRREGLVQPYVDSIESEGEYSLFYFGDKYSHAINKRPRSGDFRVQEEHGGIISSIHATDELLQAGQFVLERIDEHLLYARIDFVNWQGALRLMEVELIEPSLYFSYSPTAPILFASELDRHGNSSG